MHKLLEDILNQGIKSSWVTESIYGISDPFEDLYFPNSDLFYTGYSEKNRLKIQNTINNLNFKFPDCGYSDIHSIGRMIYAPYNGPLKVLHKKLSKTMYISPIMWTPVTNSFFLNNYMYGFSVLIEEKKFHTKKRKINIEQNNQSQWSEIPEKDYKNIIMFCNEHNLKINEYRITASAGQFDYICSCKNQLQTLFKGIYFSDVYYSSLTKVCNFYKPEDIYHTDICLSENEEANNCIPEHISSNGDLLKYISNEYNLTNISEENMLIENNNNFEKTYEAYTICKKYMSAQLGHVTLNNNQVIYYIGYDKENKHTLLF